MHRALPAILLVFLLHYLPFLINSPNAYIRVHDNLEGEWVWLHLLVDQGKSLDFSPHSMVDNALNGQPRGCYPGGISLNILLIQLLGSYWGYLISYFTLHIVAFAGMYLLLKEHFIPGEKHDLLNTGIALCFSLVPFYVQFGVAVQPFLLYSFLNIIKKQHRWHDLLLISLIPAVSSLVWTGISFIVALLVLLVYDSIKQRSLNWQYMLGIGLLSLSYAVVNFQMLTLSLFNDGFVSHRTAYDVLAMQDLSFLQGLADTLYPLILGHYHVGTLVVLPILVTAIWALSFGGARNIFLLIVVIVMICVVYGFYFLAAFAAGESFPLLVTFKANRFIILLPLLIFILFTISLKKLQENNVPKYAINVLLACQVSLGFFSNDEWLHNMRNVLGAKVKPAYRDFFAENLFDMVDSAIAQPKSSYRVACIGMSPSVAQFNGYYTIDGLLPIYSLSHKQQFREIIAPELEKDVTLKKYFDTWGNRCYLFSAELGVEDRNYIIGKNNTSALHRFTINAEAFKRMGGKFIFSALEIKNPEHTGLTLLKTFEDEKSWWRLWLYEAK